MSDLKQDLQCACDWEPQLSLHHWHFSRVIGFYASLSNSRKRVALAYHLSSSLGLTTNRQWACKEGRKLEKKVKSEFSFLPKCHYSWNLDMSPSCLAYREDSHMSLQHVCITLNVSFKWTNEWMSATPSVTDSQQALHEKCHTAIVPGPQNLHWPLCHSLGFGCLLGAGDQMQPFTTDYVHGWYCWVMVLMSVMNTSAVYFLQTGDTIKVTL